MNRIARLLPGVLLLAVAQAAHADVTGTPAGLDAALPPVSRIAPLALAAPDIDALLAADAQRTGPQPFRWAAVIDADATPQRNGEWHALADGSALWRLPVAAQGAKLVGLGFTEFALPAGAELRVYAPDGSQLRGPYGRDAGSGGQLWVPVIRGDSAVVELRVRAADRDAVRLRLGAVQHGFRGFGVTDDRPGLKSGACNVDVVCPLGDEWRDEIRSAARYTFGGFLCSGTLVNNTSGDLAPYFLTANHCVGSQSEANSVTVYWNYETSSCGGNPNGSLAQSQSGSTLVATGGNSDFTLLRLAATPSPAFHVYYAGWDRRAPAPAGVVGIHHPSGDEKRISLDDDPLVITDYLSEMPNAAENFLRIVQWDLGTTEGGSSGSGIWSLAGHHVVGTLTGGFAICSGSVDNDESDWYGRVHKHFQTAAFANALDPTHSGVDTLDGVDPAATPDDTEPDAFDFPTRRVAAGVLARSAVVTPVGYDTAIPVRVSGDDTARLSINGGRWVRRGTLEPGDTLQLRVQAPAAPGARVVVRVVAGDTASRYIVRSR